MVSVCSVPDLTLSNLNATDEKKEKRGKKTRWTTLPSDLQASGSAVMKKQEERKQKKEKKKKGEKNMPLRRPPAWFPDKTRT